MTDPRLNVNQSIVATIGLVLSIVVLAAAILYTVGDWRQAIRYEQQCVLSAADVLAPQVAPLLGRQSDESVRTWARSIKASPSVCLVAVHDKNGRIRAIEADSPILAKRAVWLKDAMTGRYRPAPWRLTDTEGDVVYGAIVPITARPGEPPVGQLTLAVRVDASVSAARPNWWGFCLPLLAAAIFAWRLGHTQLVRLVVEPFVRLGRLIRRGSSDFPANRDGQVGQLAKELQKLRSEVDHWRQQAKELERTLERKVESQTKGYLKEIRKIALEAEIDPLTGLKNRRIIDAHLERLVANHIKGGADLAVVMLDVDNFKTYNDTLGHAAGDGLLIFIGQLLGKGIRENDLAVRLGGDEFVLVLPETGFQEAAEIARRLTALFGQMAKTLKPTGKMPSLSAGVASLDMTSAKSGKELLRAADDALYQAKANGKADVVVAQPAVTDAVSSPADIVNKRREAVPTRDSSRIHWQPDARAPHPSTLAHQNPSIRAGPSRAG